MSDSSSIHSKLDNIYRRTGGFLKGICHPRGEIDGLLEAGLHWIRCDVPYPFNADGTWAQAFLQYKATCETYAARGIRTIAITPYPRAFLRNGIDPRTPDGLAAAEEVCMRIAEALRDSVGCWQITNEMWDNVFRTPLTNDEATDFLIACTKGVRRGDPVGIVGHNSGYRPRVEQEAGRSDYIGVDFYAGSWGNGGPDDFIRKIDEMYEESDHTPVILMEFGFASVGGQVQDPDAEIRAYLNERGFADLDDAVRRADEYIQTLPGALRKAAEICAPEDRNSFIHGGWEHLLKKWFSHGTLPHTEEGQAEFYRELLPKLLANEHLAGAILYCWQDSPYCGNCGAEDCPCETAWGITRVDGSRKPAYEVIRDIFTQDR